MGSSAGGAGAHERDVSNAGDDVLLRTPVGAPVFAEERPPPVDPDNPDAVRFKMHGYFRAPFRMAWRRRPQTTGDEGKYELRGPWLVDDDFYNSGFLYTPVNETDYAELFLMAGNKSLTGTVALMGSMYSDESQTDINNQMGISQAYVTYRYDPELFPDLKTHLQVKGGAFWDRFGYMEHYDTYIFGRTHMYGEEVRLTAQKGDITVSLTQGLGARPENDKANQAFSLLNYLRAAATYKDEAELGVYYMRTWSQEQPQLEQWQDADMLVWGFDVRLNSPTLGRLYGATSLLNAHHAVFLAPTIELMHSLGGTGITDNYFGTTKSDNGTGTMWNVGWQYDYSLASALRAVYPHTRPLWGGDVTASIYGLYSYVTSQQQSADPTINKDGIKYFKYGGELAWWALSWIGASVRYDRIVPNVDDDASSFRIFSPRINLRTHWMGEALIYFQWSRYFYGDRVTLRPGQVPLETVPDDNVVKIQAQMNF